MPDIPPMPDDYQPDTKLPVTTDAHRRFFWLRENGWTGPIDQDGNPVEEGAEQ